MAITMDNLDDNIKTKYIEDEMKYSYIDYSMSVIIGRALPDVRDGLKPVHRRVLYAMNSMGLHFNKAYRKSARIVGEVLGKYHPHGDSAVYDTMVRMAQEWSLRYPLVDGQGNYGSVDGDNPAAMRYTEARLQKISQEMLRDIEKKTVAMQPNFDESEIEPEVLPSVLPNLLINGSSGIAVGMATNIPPHNITEVINGVIAQIENPEITIQELMKYVKGPDFPTSAIIYGKSSIKDMYNTGRGRVVIRGRANIEHMKGNRDAVIITELPYQVNKAKLIEKIVSLVHNDKITGISDVRDESDRDGIRVVVELKRGEIPKVILNQLYKHTSLQSTFGVIMLAIVNRQPKVLNLKQVIKCYIDHRFDVITRRTQFELEKAEARAHILEGYKIALANLDEVIATIKSSKTPEIAKNKMVEKFEMTVIQAEAVLKMQLQKLTGLEIDKIEAEYLELIKEIAYLKSILENSQLVLDLIKSDLERLKKDYGDERRTEIVHDAGSFEMEDLIADEDMVITISHNGYIKRTSTNTYKAQRRGGKGLYGMETKDEDFVEHMFIASNHNYILFFSSTGQCYWLKVYDVPEGTRRSKGRPIVNLLEMTSTEKIQSFICVREFPEDEYVVMLTKNGVIKKSTLEAFSRPRKGGIKAINIKDDDQLTDAILTDGNYELVICTKNGQAIRFEESKVRQMGRTATGVIAIKLDKKNNDEVISLVGAKDNTVSILTVTENGYGKRTAIDEYRLTNRAGKGVINIKTSARNGKVVAALAVEDKDELIIITKNGIINRQRMSDISVIGRNTQGVRLIRLDDTDEVMDIARVVESDEEDTETDTSTEAVNVENSGEDDTNVEAEDINENETASEEDSDK